MTRALADAGAAPTMIDYINAHGTSTVPTTGETLAIKKVFGERARRIPISSTKSMIGHATVAAGALEAIATTLTLRIRPCIRPSIRSAGTACDLDYVPNRARAAHGARAVQLVRLRRPVRHADLPPSSRGMNVWIRIAASSGGPGVPGVFRDAGIPVGKSDTCGSAESVWVPEQRFSRCASATRLTLAGGCGRGYTVLIAHGRDGDRASLALEALGCRIVRGIASGAARRADCADSRTLPAAPVPSPSSPTVRSVHRDRRNLEPFCVHCGTGQPACGDLRGSPSNRLQEDVVTNVPSPLPFSRVIITLERGPVPPSADALDVEAAAST